MTKEEVRKLFPVGAKVKRGPNWRWGNQDCDEYGNQLIGTVADKDPIFAGLSGNSVWWINIGWSGRKIIGIFDDMTYPISDIVLAEAENVSCSVSIAPKNNDGKNSCFWCNVSTQKRGGGMYDVCPKCGK
jgi:hypothetical protein